MNKQPHKDRFTLETGLPTTHPLPGRYTARVADVDCELELDLDASGCLKGSFQAEGEALDVFGGVPSHFGEVYGVIRERTLGEALAVFRAVPQVRQLLLELDAPGQQHLMRLSHQIVFERQTQG